MPSVLPRPPAPLEQAVDHFTVRRSFETQVDHGLEAAASRPAVMDTRSVASCTGSGCDGVSPSALAFPRLGYPIKKMIDVAAVPAGVTRAC